MLTRFPLSSSQQVCNCFSEFFCFFFIGKIKSNLTGLKYFQQKRYTTKPINLALFNKKVNNQQKYISEESKLHFISTQELTLSLE